MTIFNTNMTTNDLEIALGKCITDLELAKYLKVDVRTLRKYAHGLGGVVVMPGKYRFFENKIKEIIKNAELNHEKWRPPVSSKRSSTRKAWKKETKAVSGRQQKISKKSGSMGGGNKETVGRRNGAGSRHGVF